MAVRAPEFRPELEWVNTGGRAMRLEDFRGRLLLLDFWTYGCINCVHMLPALREVEARFPIEVAIVGVHSGKFSNERVTRSIARACERLDVRHPVVNDRQFRMWREYAIRAWPTLVAVSPHGYVLWQQSGEVAADRLIARLADLIERERSAGRLTATEPLAASPPLPFTDGILRFPAKLLAAGENRLYVSDTGHHRVLEIELLEDGARGQVVRTFGNGTAGWRDGSSAEAVFRSPHGLAVADTRLFVADTENHLIRAVDLEGGEVTTVAGNGRQAWPRDHDGPAREARLNSPWDLLWHGDSLIVAMAGSHQLWRVDLTSGWAEALVGSGAEGLFDGPLRQAALAQPSGLATDGRRLLFADPEASAIRWAEPGVGTGTLVGTGLFDFGDRDGSGDEVRLQHPLAIAWWRQRGELLIADTYNHRLKRLQPASRRTSVLAGSGEPGQVDGDRETARFWEPGGIGVDPGGRRAYVADTNNHAIRVVDLESGAVATVEIGMD